MRGTFVCFLFLFFFLNRVDYLEKSKHLQDQLRDLRSEIEVLKVGEKQSEFDLIHDEQVRSGENKYSTLKRVSQIHLNRKIHSLKSIANLDSCCYFYQHFVMSG